MKLVEILARELDVWPVKAGYPLMQAYSGRLFVSSTDLPEGSSSIGTEIYIGLADDMDSAIVTRKQWQAERQRIAMEGISQLSQEHENMTMSNDAAKQYEHELWDKAAINAINGLLASEAFHTYSTFQSNPLCAAEFGADVADAFMAERAKRMKDK